MTKMIVESIAVTDQAGEKLREDIRAKGIVPLIGASGVVLEDQRRPRCYGHLDGKELLGLDIYLEKLERVLQQGNDLLKANVLSRDDTGQA